MRSPAEWLRRPLRGAMHVSPGSRSGIALFRGVEETEDWRSRVRRLADSPTPPLLPVQGGLSAPKKPEMRSHFPGRV